ncbi:MAG: VCBS repeat-containing protein [Phycisphaerales bacterium]
MDKATGLAILVTLAAIMPGHVAWAQGCPGPLYPGQTFPVGGVQAEDLLAADFNGDGITDVVTCSGSFGVWLTLGLGSGSYASPVFFDTPGEAFRLNAGDIDGDGDLDVVAALQRIGDIALLLNDGDGGLADPVILAVGALPRGVDIQDLDGDGDLDIAVNNALSGDVSILLNRGDGTFGPQVRYAVGDSASVMAAGDADGDGDMDLVFADFYGEFVVLANDGAGAFAVVERRPAGGRNPDDITLFDANGDGHLDAAVSGQGVGGVSLLLGAGDGTFPLQLAVDPSRQYQSIAAGDFDADGDTDLALAPLLGFGPARVLENDGLGQFTPRTDIAPIEAEQVVWADGDGDADLDLFTLKGGRLVAIDGDGLGGLETYSVYQPGDIGSAYPGPIAFADMDGDGDPDLVTTLFDEHRVGIALNDDGTLQPMQTFVAGFQPGRLALGDIDADGDIDVAVAMPAANRVIVMYNDGTGALDRPILLSGVEECRNLALGDIDGDGDLDVAAVARGDFNLLYIFENDGAFMPGRIYPVGDAPGRVSLADIDGDGDLDAVVGTRDGAGVLRNRGDGEFVLAPTVPGHGYGTTLGDVDQDGAIDLITGETVRVRVSLGNGDGTFGPSATFPAGTDACDVALADVDGDGKTDIVFGSGVFFNTSHAGGGLAFESSSLYIPEGSCSDSLAVADVRGAGLPDIFVSSFGVGVVAILPHRCPPGPCPADLDADGVLTIFDFLAFQNLFDAGDPIADFDGDGSLTLFDFLAFQNAFDAGCP